MKSNKNMLKISLLLFGMAIIFSFGVSSVAAANNTTSTNQNITHNMSSTTTNPDPYIQGSSTSYSTIQDTVNAAQSGDTIILEPGTYTGIGNYNIELNKNLTLIGSSDAANPTIINAGHNGGIFTIDAGVAITLENIILTNGTADIYGIIANEGGSLTVTNCTFNNNSAMIGGTIYNEGAYGIGTVTITGSTFTNNTAYSGAIYNDGDSLTVTNCTFTGNIATGYGGAIYNDGYYNTATANVIDSTFTNNTATCGGAIWNVFGNLTVTSSTFNSNTAYSGGAIYNGGGLTVTNSTLNNNTATYGGAICNDESFGIATVDITNSTLNNNTATYGGVIYNYYGSLTVTNSTLNNNTADYGGAIYNDGASGTATVTITDSTFTKNTATYGGGAIFNYGTLTVTNSTFNSNTADDGGAICNDGNDGNECTATVNITSSTLNNNTANDANSYCGGGAICNIDDGGTAIVDVTSSTLNNNTANDENSYGRAICNIDDGGTATVNITSSTLNYNDGGALYNSGQATVNFCWITGNTGTDIYNDGGSMNAEDNWWGSNFDGTDPESAGRINAPVNAWIVLNVSASPNTVSPNGSSTVTADLTHNNQNQDTSSQGHIPDGIPVIFNATLGNITNGTTVNGKAQAVFTAGNIGGIATITTPVDSQLSTVITVLSNNVYVSPTGNDNTGDGSQNNPVQTITKAISLLNPNGTIYLANGNYIGTGNYNITINTNMTIICESQNGTIINAQGQGRIFNIASGVTLTLENLTLTNGATSMAGAISNGGTLTVTNCTFTNNTVTSTSYGFGGAISNYYNGVLTVTNCTFTNNTVTGSATGGYNGEGGAIFNQGILTVTNSTFTSNTATSDGEGGAIFNWDTLTVTNCTFTSNTATGYGMGSGGAICNYNGILTVNNTIFINNTATGTYDSFGGAIYNYGAYSTATITITNSTLNNNTATYGNGEGGAIYNNGEYGTATVTITNSTLNNNIALFDGGAIHNDGTITVTNSTLNNNTVTCTYVGSGGAIFNFGTLTVTNSTLNNNTVAINSNSYGGAIYNSGGTCTVQYNRIVGNIANTGSAIYHSGYFGGSFNANYNWWGSNIDPTIIPNLIVENSGSVNATSWVILTVNANSTIIHNRGTASITADLNHYMDSDGNIRTLTGYIPDGILVTFASAWGSFTQSSTTTVNGQATTTFNANGVSEPTTNPVQIYALADNENNAYTPVKIIIPTTVTVAPVDNFAGQNVTLTANVTDYYTNQVNGGTVTFYVEDANGNQVNAGTANVNSSGIASLTWTIPPTWNIGQYTITADFDGTGTNYANSTNSINLTVDKAPTNLTVGNASDFWHQYVDITANLTDYYGNLLNGETITFTIAGDPNTYTAVTGANGVATLHYQIVQNAGIYAINAAFSGDNNYLASTTSLNGNLTVNPTPTNVTANSVHDFAGQNVTLTANVKDYYDNPVTTGSVKFTVNGVTSTVSVDNSGTATLTNWTIPNWNVGTYSILAEYIGTDNFTASNSTGNLTVDPTPTSLTVSNVTSRDNQTVTLNATLTDIYSHPLTGQTVNFNINGHNYTATTNNNGIASLQYTPNGAGNYTITANYQGNEEYVDSQGTGTLTVDPTAYLYLNSTVSKNNPTTGEPFTITYKLSNSGPDNATNVTVSFQISEGLEFIGASDDSGNWTYNPNNRTITWTLDNVAVGDPYLYLQVKPLNTGSFTINPTITSQTFNQNTQNIPALTINAVNQPANNNSGSDNGLGSGSSVTVKAASNITKTIGMQDTGLPITGLVLAVLAIFSGLAPRRK